MIDLAKYQSITWNVISAAMEVHNKLGFGFPERIYQHAIEHELIIRGIPFQPQYNIDVYYKGTRVGSFIPDLLIDGKIIVELKSLETINFNDIQKQIINYLLVSRLEVGLLLNFGKPELEFKRIIIPLKFQ